MSAESAANHNDLAPQMPDIAPPSGLALREAHAHLSSLGRSLTMCDLSRASSASDLLTRLAAHAPDANGWVLGFGARPEGWADPHWPTLAALDQAVQGRPALVWCFDYHAMLANSAALQHAKLEPGTPIQGGVIETDTAGKPTGVLLEHAAGRLWQSVPEPTPAERIEHVANAMKHLAALGFVEVHDLKSEPWLGSVLMELEAQGRLPMRVGMFPLVEQLPEIAAGRAAWERDSIWLAGGKVFVDGTLNSRTAWMLEPYAEAPPTLAHGMALLDEAAIAAALSTCETHGVGFAAHAIGDGAVRSVLNAIEQVQPRVAGPRIEHAELIDAADVPRFAQLGVVCSPQPCHLLADIEALQRAVPARLDRVLPLRELMDAGLEPGRTDGPGLIFGSDVPIVRADPVDSVVAATLRRRPGMPEADAIGLSQALTEAECWTCFGSRFV